jgi:hypothetical protein
LSAAVCCLLAGHFFLGLAHVAALPPWEGFDETAHYSYLQQLSDRWELPRLDVARLSGDVEKYGDVAPLPYTATMKSRGLTYKSFFEAPGDLVARAKLTVHGRPHVPRQYVAGTTINWAAKNPPLYYAMLSPVYRATRHLSWALHLFWLRLTSYLLAWLALILGIYSCAAARSATAGGSAGHAEWGMLGLALWPLVAPGWFPEMGRLGHDSLSALILAGVWLIVVRDVGDGLSIRSALMLGVLLGAGCLTRSFFVPITAGIAGFSLTHAFRQGGLVALPLAGGRLALMVLIAAGMAGWWYVRTWQEYGVELMAVEKAGGLFTGLLERFSLAAWLRGHAAVVATIAWSGTWSAARPPYAFLAPLALLLLVATGAYAAALSRLGPTPFARLPAWVVTPVVIGLSYHVLVQIALTGEGRGTGGHYLHLMVAPLGIALGLGLGAWWARRAFRTTMALLVGYALLFAVAISAAQVLLFGGWLFRAGDSKFYQAPAALPSLLGLPDALDRLSLLAYPTLGAAAWVVGGACVLLGLALAWTATRAPARG